jgi:hypothetical protein
MSRSDRERVEGFHRIITSAVTQTPDDPIATVCLTPPQPLALLGLRPALLVPRTIGLAASAVLRHARQRAPTWLCGRQQISGTVTCHTFTRLLAPSTNVVTSNP